jgi:putative heme-binding domain-containing protein
MTVPLSAYISAALVLFAPDAEPKLVVAWAAGPMEVRIAFDRPLDPGVVKAVVDRSIDFGVAAADASTKPPSASVPARGSLRIAAARLADAGRTLLLTTDPHPVPGKYVCALPGIKAPRAFGHGTTLNVIYALNGTDASWTPAKPSDRNTAWSLWWPHVDPELVRMRARGSLEHEQSLASLAQSGQLAFDTLVTLPKAARTLAIEASVPFEADLGEEHAASKPGAQRMNRLDLKVESSGEPIGLRLHTATGTGGKPPALHLFFRSAGDRNDQVLPMTGMQPAWVPPPPPEPPAAIEPPPSLAGADPTRGQAVFESKEARCSSCHKIRGQGGTVGPDLSDLPKLDLASLYRDIRMPSAIINPNYYSYVVALRDGQVITGIVHAESAHAIRVTDTDAKDRIIARTEIEEMRPTHSSIMPEGLVAALGDDKVRDLLAFLMAPEKANPFNR